MITRYERSNALDMCCVLNFELASRKFNVCTKLPILQRGSHMSGVSLVANLCPLRLTLALDSFIKGLYVLKHK